MEGIPLQLRIASKSARRSTPMIPPKQVLTREEMREALIALREKIERECPDADPARAFLRQNMLDEFFENGLSMPMSGGQKFHSTYGKPPMVNNLSGMVKRSSRY